MNKDHLRKHFGIEPCNNPIHRFQLGALIGQWQWGNRCWSWIDNNECENIMYLHIGGVRNYQYVKAWQIVVWRFKLIFGWI